MTYLHFPPNDIDPLCDFCSDRSIRPVAALLVKTRELPPPDADGMRRISEGEWYVCRPCLDLILARDYRALHRRAADTYIAKHRLPQDFIPRLQARFISEIATMHRAALDQLQDWPTRY